MRQAGYNVLSGQEMYDRVMGNERPSNITYEQQALLKSQTRPGYTDPSALGDTNTQNTRRGVEAANRAFGLMGMPLIDTEAATGGILETQRQNAYAKAGQVAPGDISSNPGFTKEERFFTGELQKWGENKVEVSSAYHDVGQKAGVPIPANRYEYAGDLAVEFLKGTPKKSSERFSPVSGEMGPYLPGGEGLQEYGWRGAVAYDRRATRPGEVSFMDAVGKLNAAEGQYGPYGSLYGGDKWMAANPQSPSDTLKMHGIRLTDQQASDIDWAAGEGSRQAKSYFDYGDQVKREEFTNKSFDMVAAGAAVSDAIQNQQPQQQNKVDILGALGGFERAMFQAGPVNIMDVMKSPAGTVLAVTNPALMGMKFHADYIAGSKGAQTVEGYDFGEYSKWSEDAGMVLEKSVGVTARELQAKADDPDTGLLATFGYSAAAETLRNPGALPVAAAQGVLISPVFEAGGVALSMGAAKLGGQFSARGGVVAAKVAEKAVPTAFFGGMIGYGATGGFTDFSPKGIAVRGGAMAPTTVAMIAPVMVYPRVSEAKTWYDINKAAKTPAEKSMVSSLSRIQKLTKGVDTGVERPLDFAKIKYVGEEGAGALKTMAQQEPGVGFGSVTMQVQSAKPARGSADFDYMTYRTGAGNEALVKDLAGKMGSTFTAEKNLVVRNIPGETQSPHAVDVHSFVERTGGSYSPPFDMKLPVSKIKTIDRVNYEPLYLQETRKATAALGAKTEKGWEFFPESTAHRTVKDVGDVVAMGRNDFVPALKKTSPNRAIELQKAIDEYANNPLIRPYLKEYERMYGTGPSPGERGGTPPRVSAESYRVMGYPSASGFVSSPSSSTSSRRSSAPSSPSQSSSRPSVSPYPAVSSRPSSIRTSSPFSTPSVPSISPSVSPTRSSPGPSSRPSSTPSSPPSYVPSSRPSSTPSSHPSSTPYYPPYTPPLKPKTPFGGYPDAGGSQGDKRYPRTSVEGWQNTNPVADLDYLSKGLGSDPLSKGFGAKCRHTSAKLKKKCSRFLRNG